MQDIKPIDLENVTGGADAKDALHEWQDFCGTLYAKAKKKRLERYTPAAAEWEAAAGLCMDHLGTARDNLGVRAQPE